MPLTVRSLLNNDREAEREHLTALPALDMEHFSVSPGVFRCVPPRRANPGKCTDESAQSYLESDRSLFQTRFAIEVAMEAGRRGVDSAPTLLKKMFSRARGWRRSGRRMQNIVAICG
ncbi:hypothetical protein ACLK2I_04735 [Escherichia coli]